MLPARSKRLARRRATQRVRLGSARVSRARDGVPPSRTFCVRYQCPRLSLQGKTVSARRRNQHAGRVRYPKQTKLSYFAYKFPPTQRVGLVWPRPHRPALILLFAKKFFRPAFAGRMRWTGQIFWLLALPSSRLHSRIFSGIGPMESRIQLQQRNCSRFSRDFLRRSTFSSSQRTGSRSSGSRLTMQDFIHRWTTNRRPSETMEPPAASVSSCSAKASRIALRFSVEVIALARYRK